MHNGHTAISFDLHDTILVFKLGSKFSKIKFFRAIYYFLGNFRFFIFLYTLFSHRNEQIIELMKQAKTAGNKVIILTSTYKKSAKIIHYFLNKNDITDYDEVIFRKSLFQKESDYKLGEIIKNDIALHYDDNVAICTAINTIKRTCVVISRQY
ncbi:MAG: hypothetical protein A2445_04420 [Candidatus Jacksonbacteria bacterium RIFOXYC2_FULL_44_29]|nr:MAG: hypothetical protein UV19_C0003G0007 [Parcubacteria group bacterium GW2011_GWA2_42_28]KKT55826.1 MAG: hypothetical protein UW45_C0004G0007 [Parcubacteria group bacterium GW2011_GWC2_44_22]OGY75606.1 MAG: hypothetical protein A2240_03610 [Candidatus Jacksonbacteria bacterium RIFOXYA2_FULL_43_12]OGY76580.1 MAG: hypothetical protein A2295_01350 [Candidatus Jacksonbacteria bacterium RIFOXYB2_FULL_44_15]OGY78304.1 MAG: hypothetical protein A2445_04420 [Candidatus Jacksonbacteria bacterium RI